MATYKITSPSGESFRVTAPDGATQDQVLEYAKSQWSKGDDKADALKAPVEDPGIANTMLIGAGRTFDRIGKGMEQIYYGATGQGDKQAALKAQVADDDAIYKRLQEKRPFATGIGEAAPSMILPAGGSATLLGNVGRMAVAGAAPELLQYGDAADRMARGGAAALAASAVPLGVAGFKSAKSLAEPLYQGGRNAIAGRTLNRVSGDDAATVIQKLRSAKPLVPGSMPTAAQVAENGGIAALERSASASNPAAYTARAMEQASARLGVLRNLAGDDAMMTAAEAARDGAAKALYNQADAGMAPIDSFFKGLQMRPQFTAAVKRAQELAKDKGLDDIFFRDSKGKPVALIGEGAHYIKKALDEAAEFGSKSYTGKASASAAGKTNDLFQSWLDKSIPEYNAAKAAYAAGSKPINQMQVGRALMDKAQPALADFGALGRETGATFGTAMRNADDVAAKATGMRGATMADVLEPSQFQAVQNVAKDLARKANAQDLGRGAGSDTFQKLSMQNIAEQSGMPKLASGLLDLPVVSRATNWIYRDSDEKMQKMLADLLLDPAKAADVMQKATPKQMAQNPALRKLLEQSVIRSGGLLGTSYLAQP